MYHYIPLTVLNIYACLLSHGLLFRYCVHLEKGVALLWTNLNQHLLSMPCAKFGWNWPSSWKCEKFTDRQTDRRRLAMLMLMLVILMLMLVILMLILMLLNLNTGYADANTNLCIRIMSAYCTLLVYVFDKFYKHLSHRCLIFPSASMRLTSLDD